LEQRDRTVEGRGEARLQFLRFIQVRVSLTSVILIVFHHFMIGLGIGKKLRWVSWV